MKQNSKERFGEKAFDKLGDFTLPTEWGPKYERARAAADTAIQKYNLSEEDFWIKKKLDLSDMREKKIIYENLIISHAAALKINIQLPADMQFKPSCVKEAKGVDGGVAFIYVCDEQNLFMTGEAARPNNSFPFPYAIASKRLIDRVILSNSGLYSEGVYSESEAEEFGKPAAQPLSAQPYQAPVAVTQLPADYHSHAEQIPASTPASSATPQHVNVEKINWIRRAIAFTGTDEQKILNCYHVFSLEEINDENLNNIVDVLSERVVKKKAEIASANNMTVAAPAASSGTTQEISPIAAMLLGQDSIAPADSETMDAAKSVLTPEAVPVGQTIYSCIEGAPENFVSLCGQTFDQIGVKLLKALYGRKNAAGRRWVDEDILAKIEEYISA